MQKHDTHLKFYLDHYLKDFSTKTLMEAILVIAEEVNRRENITNR